LKELDKILLNDVHFKHLVENSSDMIFRLNDAGDFLYVNPACTAITGYTREELLGMNFSHLLRADKKDFATRFYSKQVEEKTPSSYLELPYMHKDGKLIWIGQNVILEERANGFQLAVIARDISERMRLEKQQQTRNARLLVLIENLQEGVLVEDENRKITLVNRAFCDLFSFRLIPEDFLGKDYSIAINHIKKLFRDGSAFTEHENNLLANKNISIGKSIDLTDGRIFEIDYIPIYIETGYMGNLWKYRDTTEKNKVKNDLIKSEKKYKSIIDTMRLGLLEVDTNGRILSANDSFCQILEYNSVDELIGLPADTTLLDEDQQRIMKEQMEMRKAGDSNAYEIKVKKANGTDYAWMLISGAPLYDHNGKVIGSVGVHLDISYQKKIAIELEEKKAMKSLMEWQEKAMEHLEEKVIERTSEVVKQKEIIEYKNKEITNSITYALRIQQALLPNKNELDKALPESFILYNPKDIVSGDFYYFNLVDDGICYLAAADSTGHGVPGGFMSMLGSEKLNDAVLKGRMPGEILSLLNKSIKGSLRHTERERAILDGFDIALCLIDMNTRTIHYAGAHRPIWVIRKGSDAIEEIKATKAAIGGWTEESQEFETHQLQLEEGDSFYIFSDGFADQFGTTNKRLMTKKFKEILLSISNKKMPEQGRYLEDFYLNWKGEEEQTDDILVIGARV
jgi:PAS domain S-box-containing protein